MDPVEEGILDRFIARRLLRGTFFTDVGLGTASGGWYVLDAVCVEGLEPELEPIKLREKWWQTLKDRVRGHDVWIIEVKRKLNMEALGQILNYSYHFPKTYTHVRLKGKCVVCEEGDKSVEESCQYYGVKVFVI